MFDKIKAGLLLSLFLAISAGSAGAFLIGPQESSSQVLGAQCKPAGSLCHQHKECCSRQCFKENGSAPGRCAPPPPPPPSSSLRPTVKLPEPTMKPPQKPKINRCFQLKSLKYRIYWIGKSIDYLCSKDSKNNQNLDCKSLNSIKQSLLSLTQKADQLYQQCLKKLPE